LIGDVQRNVYHLIMCKLLFSEADEFVNDSHK